MKKWKRLLCLILAMVMLPVLAVRPAEAAETKANKKVVAIVYDDSGSMSNNKQKKWAYANYAVQTFTALMNTQDELYICYMSDVTGGDSKGTKINLSDIEGSVKKIRGTNRSASTTPYDSIRVGMDTLIAAGDKDVRTKYWLVVMTDGGFYDKAGKAVPSNETQAYLEGLYKKDMPNGTKAQVMYMAIGTGAGSSIALNSNSGKNLTCEEAGDDAAITKVLSEISDQISGRTRLDKSEVSKVDDKTIKIKSDLPLYTISLLSQRGATAVKEAESGAKKLDIDRNVPLKYPENGDWQTDKSLLGNAVVITDGKGVIDAGEFTIRFSEKVDLDNVDIMYEPAIECKLEVFKDGKKVDDFSELEAGDEIDLKGTIVKAGTDEEIDMSLLPSGTKIELSVSEDGKVVRTEDGLELSGYQLQEKDTLLKGQIQIPGYSPAITTIPEFKPVKPIIYSIEIEKEEDLAFELVKLDKNEKSIRFYLSANGKRLGKAEAEAAGLTIVKNSSGIAHDWYLEDDGAFVFKPKKVGLLKRVFTRGGNQSITVAVTADDRTQAEAEFKVIKSIWDYIILIAILIITLLILRKLWLIYKQHKAKFDFNNQVIHRYEYYLSGTTVMEEQVGEPITLKKETGRTFLENSKYKHPCGLSFEATGKNRFTIHAESFKKYQGAYTVELREFDPVNGAKYRVQEFKSFLLTVTQNRTVYVPGSETKVSLGVGEALIVQEPEKPGFITIYYRTV